MPIKVVITDDHLMLIQGLAATINAAPDMEVTGTFNSGETLLKGIAALLPDVLMLDMQMPGMQGDEVAAAIVKQYPSIKILILTGVDAALQVKDMMQIGCLGYLLKGTTDADLLLNAIREVDAGHLFIDPSMKEALLQNMLQEKKVEKDVRFRLTQREKEVLKLILAEDSNQEIADKLFISLRTVENHRFNIFNKLGAKNTVGLIKIAVKMGLKF